MAGERISEATSLVYEETLSSLTRTVYYCQALSDPDLQADLQGSLENKSKTVDDSEDVIMVTTKDIIDRVDHDFCGIGIGSATRSKKLSMNGKKASKADDNHADQHANKTTANGVLTNGDSTKAHVNGHVKEDEDEEPQSPVAKRKKPKVSSPKLEPDQEMADFGDLDLDTCDSRIVIRSYLLLLKEDDRKYLIMHPSDHRNSERWSVDFSRMSRTCEHP